MKAAQPHQRKLVRQKTKEVLHKLGSESNTHGIAKIISTRSRRRQLFWSILLIGGVIGATTHLTILSLRYFEYNTYYASKEVEDKQTEFPFVTICPNQMPFKHPEQLEDYSPDKKYAGWNFLLRFFDYPSDAYDHFSSWNAYVDNFPSILDLFALECEKVVLNCRYRQKKCTCSNFKDYIDKDNLVRCYTFNVSTMIEEVGSANAAEGSYEGLSLILGVDDQKYKTEFNLKDDLYQQYDMKSLYGFSTGFVVEVHAQDTIPSPLSHGFYISTSQSTTVSLRSKLREIQPYPYSNCSDEYVYSDVPYRRTLYTCGQVCKQNEIVEKCKCLSSALPLIGNGSMPECGILKDWENITRVAKGLDNANTIKKKVKKIIKNWECANKVRKNPKKMCHCSPCSERGYTYTMSATRWPSEEYVFDLLYELSVDLNPKLRTLYDKLRAKVSHKFNASFNEMEVINLLKDSSRNIARLNIYFEDLITSVVEEVPSYPLTNLLADVGGGLGLWIGISALSMMEIIELAVMVLCIARHKDEEEHGKGDAL